MAGRRWQQGRAAGAVPWRTHIGVAGPVPPSLAQTVLAPNGWPGRSRGQRREMRPRGMEAVGGLTVGRERVPRADLGLSHCRLEDDTPPPHDLLQSPHGVHGPQAPSTPSGRDPKGTHTRL